MIALINLIRILFLSLLLAPLYFINKNKAVFCFLKFSGPSFLKLGQILSVRPDLVGEELAKILSQFQDRLPPFSQKKVKNILEKEFGNKFDRIFSNFEYATISSASIAQVHKATLANGNIVAVKILRPNINKIISRDIKTLKMVIAIAKIFSKFLAKSLSNIAHVLNNVVKSELDLLLEGANASKLKEDLQDVEGIYVPKIFWQYSTNKILVLEWIDGIAFSNKEAIAKSSFDKKQIAKNLVISYFTQVYGNGFFHGDMHPGNLFLMNDGKVALVDFGIVGKLDKNTRINVAEILIGFLDKDYERVAKLHISGGLVPKNTSLEDLSLSCRKIGETIIGSDVKDISVAKLLANLLMMTKRYNMEANPDLLLLQKTLLLVEGVGITLDPNLNMWELARPWVKEWAKKNISFDAKIRDSIFDIIDLTRDFLRKISK